MSKVRSDSISNKADNGPPILNFGAQVPVGYGITGAGDINITGVVTAASGSFSGDVSIGGTLTYQDVTNQNSIGIITANNGIVVASGGINVVSGVVTATSFVGSGASLTNIDGSDWRYNSLF